MRLCFAMIGLMLLVAGCQPTFNFERVHKLVGHTAPDFVAPLLDNEKMFQLSEEYSDQIIVLDFWATWCGPCLAELPVLLKIAEDYQDRGVALYAVNALEDEQTIRAFLGENRLDFNVVLDQKGRVGKTYHVSGIPHLVIIDRGGIVKKVQTGYHRSLDKDLRRELDQLLSARTAE
jgi:thiol-disulfide isomerase/thioredoxin